MKSDIIYSYGAIQNNTDEELIRKLKDAWDYSSAQRLNVVGKIEIKRVSSLTKKPVYVLTDLRSTNDFTPLKYPIQSPSSRPIDQDVYLPPQYLEIIKTEREPGDLCVVDVQLASLKERERQGNLFSLQACSRVRALKELPIDASGAIEINGKYYLEKEVVDFYKQKHKVEIEAARIEDFEKIENDYEKAKNDYVENSKEMQSAIDALSITQSKAEQHIEQLQTRSSETKKKLLAAEKSLRKKDKELKSLTEKYLDRKSKMESSLERLTEFVEQKTEKLIKLELIEESDLQHLLGINKTKEIEGETISFSEVFDGDLEQAIKYIQAFLYRKDIFYKQDLLRDFFALLRMNELIILAGDSGSGKTNLVRSMAEAINGKSVIIPVKPNWTSSEDLLGYYNPLEKKYLSTPFLDALIEASNHPEVPYLICLDEMNLARVEYYFADFLSLLEDRASLPEIYLYSDAEAAHTLAEVRTFLRLTEEISAEQGMSEIEDYVDMLKNKKVNSALSQACGFSDGSSLLKYHSHLRRILSGFINTPSSIKMPGNVRIIGTINVDETTHYLSPKILDRAQVIRFSSPLLTNWERIEKEIYEFPDLSKPLKLEIEDFGCRQPYPRFDRKNEFAKIIVQLAQEYLIPLGMDFGLRTVRQAMRYFSELETFSVDKKVILNNFILHKVLPKLMFDGNKDLGEVKKSDLLVSFRNFIDNELSSLREIENIEYCVRELDVVIENAKANDWVVNYWTR